MLEKEWKWLVTKERFEALLHLAEYFTQTKGSTRLQLNHYYDTIDRKMAAQNICVRIRQTEAGLLGTVKKHGENGISEETGFRVETLPRFITYETCLTHRLGVLVTQRTDFAIGKIATLSFDRNFYLGETDYEIELEFSEEQAVESLDGWYRACFPADRFRSKYERFLAALDRLERENETNERVIGKRDAL